MIDLSRLLAGATALAVLAVAGCSGEDPAPAAGDAFTYTDARGTSVELDEVPDTVVAQSSVAAALWDNGLRVDGVYGELPEPLDYQTGELDPDGMTVLGSTWGEFNVEEYAALDPDLLVDMTFDLETLWYAAEVEDQIAEVAPTIGMQLTGLSVTEQIDAFVDLAERLGAEPDLDEPKADFDAATERVREAVEATPDLTVLALALNEDQVYFANASEHPDLAHLAELGVQFVDVEPDESGVWETVSLENLGQYDADVILVDARSAAGLAELQEREIWQRLPAVAAGQQHLWYPAAPYSYRSYAEVIDEYAAHLDSADAL